MMRTNGTFWLLTARNVSKGLRAEMSVKEMFLSGSFLVVDGVDSMPHSQHATTNKYRSSSLVTILCNVVCFVL